MKLLVNITSFTVYGGPGGGGGHWLHAYKFISQGILEIAQGNISEY